MNIDLQRVLEEAAKKLEAIPLRNGTDGKLTKDDEPTTNGEIDSKLSGLRIYYDESCVAGGGGGVAEDPEQNGIGDEDGYTHDITDMFHKCCTNGLALGEIINRQKFVHSFIIHSINHSLDRYTVFIIKVTKYLAYRIY